MATTKVIKTVFQFRRAKTTEWELNKSIIPAAGEPCFDLDLSTLRIGNGVDTYENLKPIGGVKVDIATDGSSIVMQDNVLKLSGFDAAEIGAQPRKNAEGKLEWVVPSTETVEGLQATVAGLQSDVTSLQTTVINIQEIVNPSAEGAVPLLDRLESLEAKVDGTGEDSIEAKVEEKVDAKIEAFASMLTPDDGKVNTLLEVINYVEEHGQETLNMANEITDLKSLVGEVSVADQISEATNTLLSNVVREISVNGTLLDIVDGRVDINIAVGVKSSDEIEVAEDGTLKIKSISFDKIAQSEDEVIVMDGGSAAN